MALVDVLIIIGAIVLAVIVIMGFRHSNRIPPSGRDPSNFEGPP
jgi:FtsZ-interacting cell division protein ZipA